MLYSNSVGVDAYKTSVFHYREDQIDLFSKPTCEDIPVVGVSTSLPHNYMHFCTIKTVIQLVLMLTKLLSFTTEQTGMTSPVNQTCRPSACAFYQLLHVHILYGWQLEMLEVKNSTQACTCK